MSKMSCINTVQRHVGEDYRHTIVCSCLYGIIL